MTAFFKVLFTCFLPHMVSNCQAPRFFNLPVGQTRAIHSLSEALSLLPYSFDVVVFLVSVRLAHLSSFDLFGPTRLP